MTRATDASAKPASLGPIGLASEVDPLAPAIWRPDTRRRRRNEQRFTAFMVLAFFGTLVVLATLVGSFLSRGADRLGWSFLGASPLPEAATLGVRAALVGSAYLALLTAVIAVPIGVGAAVYLEEFAGNNLARRVLDLLVANLAGVPSILFGMLGLAFFVRQLDLGHSLISGALTMSALVLPIIVVSAREALKAVPASVRLAAYGLGATRWQTVRSQVLPAAGPAVLTGVIMAMSRAAGETAPLLMIGALAYASRSPTGLTDVFSALPVQIFHWASAPQADHQDAAAAGILVLLGLLLAVNAVAILLRMHYQGKDRW
jgi:phosphate transport system permease protein